MNNITLPSLHVSSIQIEHKTETITGLTFVASATSTVPGPEETVRTYLFIK